MPDWFFVSACVGVGLIIILIISFIICLSKLNHLKHQLVHNGSYEKRYKEVLSEYEDFRKRCENALKVVSGEYSPVNKKIPVASSCFDNRDAL